MSTSATYLFIVSMDVASDKEALFNEVYDTEHVPNLLKVPGVISAKRYVDMPFSVMIGGETRTIAAAGEPRYHAIYEIESPAVLMSAAWAEACEAGRWPGEVRPYTHNHRHLLRKPM